MPLTEAELWKVYANKIKDSFLQGSDFGPQNKIFIPPINAQVIPASRDVKQSQTNFGVFRASDALLQANNPSLTPSNGGYAQTCLNYLRAVQPTSRAAGGMAQLIDQRFKQLSVATDAFQKTAKEARAAWKDSYDYHNEDFSRWVMQNYPMYNALESQQSGAVAGYDSIMQQIHGAEYNALSDMAKRVARALEQQSSQYTMAVNSAFPGATENNTADEYRPQYNIRGSYVQRVEDWNRSPNETSLVISASETSNYKWSSVGFEDSKVNTSTGFRPLLKIESRGKSEEVKIDSSSSSLSVKVVADGIGSFDVSPSDSWNPGNIKKTYPTLIKSAPKQLSDPIVQVSKIVVGYNVRVEITLDSNTYKNIISNMDAAQRSGADASATLFGCRLNVGGRSQDSELNSTNWSDVKKNDADNTLVIPASSTPIPVLLAVVGTVLS